MGQDRSERNDRAEPLMQRGVIKRPDGSAVGSAVHAPESEMCLLLSSQFWCLALIAQPDDRGVPAAILSSSGLDRCHGCKRRGDVPLSAAGRQV